MARLEMNVPTAFWPVEDTAPWPDLGRGCGWVGSLQRYRNAVPAGTTQISAPEKAKRPILLGRNLGLIAWVLTGDNAGAGPGKLEDAQYVKRIFCE